MKRMLITPGRLYARLSAELVKVRPAGCESCAMPLPYLVHRAGAKSANWAVDDEVAACSGCTLIAGTIVRRLSRHYDLWDPVSVAVAPHTMALRSTRLDPHPKGHWG